MVENFTKKSVFLMMITVLILTTFLMSMGSVNASEEVLKSESKNGYTIDTLASEKELELLRFTNEETGEVEYLKSEMVDGEVVRTSNTDDGEHTITEENGRVLVDGEVVFTESQEIENSASDFQAMNMLLLTTREGSASGLGTDVSLAAGILASVAFMDVNKYVAVGAGVATALATAALSRGMNEVWYTNSVYHDSSDNCSQEETSVIYGDPGRTMYLETEFHSYNICN